MDEEFQDLGLEIGTVLEGGGCVCLPEAAWIGCIQLQCQIREIRDADGGCEGWDRGEFVEDGRVGDRLGVLVVVAEDVGALNVGRRDDQRGVGVRGAGCREVGEGVVDGGVCCDGVDGQAAPHRPLGKGVQIETGDDAEVVAAAAEGEIEVWMGMLVYVEDVAVCENDLVV